MSSLENESISRLSSESSITRAENRICDIEEEIEAQGIAIENYIRNHETESDDSEPLIALRALYKLFRKEVSLNNSLRRQITQTIPSNKHLTAENQRVSEIITGFIREAGIFYHTTFRDLNDITEFFLDHIDQSLEAEQQVKTLREIVQQEKSLKTQLNHYITSSEANSHHITEYGDALSMKLVELSSELENVETNCSILKNQITCEEQKKDELLHQIDMIKKGSEIYMEQIEYQRNDFDKVMNTFRNKKAKRKIKIAKIMEEIDSVKLTFKCLLKDKQKLDFALSQARNEKEIIENKSNEEISELQKQKEVYEKLLDDILKKFTENKPKKEELFKQKSQLERKIAKFEKDFQRLSIVSTEWKTKLKAKNQIKQQIFDDIDRYSNTLLKLQEECKTSDVEQYLDMRQSENDSLLIENKKLESILRVTLKNIQKMDDQNLELKASILQYQSNPSQ
ncbi:hypothetical protein TRFO_10227 [Tritrichomonas foetus]|uniref:Uncharacterized protein n=1 Tax=Tritrichomonas foetus TaxID=1144522 RepID=A0A1J4JFP1_9EUKA|nr:hypothetical protein TRFO_10227 [Tritrichomonas foetus]|eukprot:OHS96044.1 hypothetical protein TRFO_10227 [Tritrichomonas foetus]